MTDAAAVAALARALGDESRAAMCLAMLDGMSWTVSELAGVAGVSLPTASEHVTRLVESGVAAESRQGRCRYVGLASPTVAAMLEDLASLTTPAPPSSLRGVGQRRRLAAARTCYDHLAGRLGVALFDGLVDHRLLATRGGLTVTSFGHAWFAELDIDVTALESERRTLVRECLDWTERRPHLAGSLGAALCATFLDRQWVRRPDRTRRLEVTAPGQRELQRLLGLTPAGFLISAP